MFGHDFVLGTNGKIPFIYSTSIDIFSTEKCKVTFSLKYIFCEPQVLPTFLE